VEVAALPQPELHSFHTIVCPTPVVNAGREGFLDEV